MENIRRKNESLYRLILKQLYYFRQQPKNRSLKLHKLGGGLQDTWSISINKSLRMVFYYRDTNDGRLAVFINLGNHRQVYGN